MEGHCAGLCLLMAAHAREPLCGAILLDEAETQTDNVTTTSVNTQMTPAATPVDFSIQAAPQTMEIATQTFVEHPNTPLDAATSLPSMMPTMSSTTTTTLLLAPKPPPTPHE
jgi:hypothetical protein